jgi:crotonobetainyl-CoA:carnitine CoA-transferase CaiB-like acyl-CoA transferase
MQATHITDHLHSGHNPKRNGNKMRFAETSMFEAKDGLIQLAASNPRQHRRFYKAIDEPAEAERTSIDERYGRYEEKFALVAGKMKEKTADEWENYLEDRHIPAMRVRELRETLADPQLKHRGLLHRHDNIPGVDKPVTVPVAAFKFKHDGPSLERPPARMGEHTEAVLKSAGYSADEIAALRKEGAIV